MKFGYQQPSHTFGPKQNIFKILQSFATKAHDLEFDSFWIMDHLTQIDLVGNIGEPIMEPYTALAGLAASTSGIKLGVLCTCNYFRNPALLAKIGATIDQISGGRFWLGIGAGWYRREAQQYGYSFENDKTRLGMLEESLQIIKKVWTEKRPSFHGKFYTIDDLVLSPKPLQKPHPPILVGGEGERITLKLVAKYADACNLFSSGEELERKLDALKEHCRMARRDYSKILKTKLATVMFGRNKEDSLIKMKKLKPPYFDPDSFNNSFLYGTPSDMAKQIESLKNLGIGYLMINFRGKQDPSNMKKFAKAVMSSF